MVSFYIESSSEIRKRHLLYILASLLILVLSSAGAVVEGISMYNMLLNISRGPENVDAGWTIVDTYTTKLVAPASLLGDLAFRVADALLVCLLSFSHLL